MSTRLRNTEALILPPGSRNHARGFTLLEIMVAMVVLAMIVTTSFGALRMGERSWEAGLARAGETDTLRTLAGVLQRQFNQALPLSWSEDTETFIAFSGDGERLRFIAPAPLHHGATGLFEYTLAVEADQTGKQLVLYYRVYDPDYAGFQPEGAERQRVLLAEELKSGTFAYYGAPIKDEAPQWHSFWSSEAEAYPKLVRARLQAKPAQQAWPELYLALRTTEPIK